MLIAVVNEAQLTLEDLRAALRRRDSPTCTCPGTEGPSEIPKLGTGKVNYQELSRWSSARHHEIPDGGGLDGDGC